MTHRHLTFNSPRKVLADPRTGREVWQLTDGDFECVAPYMDKPAWSADDRYLVFASNRRGSWQPFRMEIETGEVTQLAEVSKGNFRSIVVRPASGEVFCQSGVYFLAVNIETLETRMALDISRFFSESGDGVKGFAASLNRDGSRAAMSYRHPDGRGAVIFATTDGTNAFEVTDLPRTDVDPGLELVCTADDNIISFHGYPDRQNRAQPDPLLRTAQWRIERDSGRMKPLVLMPEGFRATHCLWGPLGERFYLHRKSVPNWTPTALCSVNQDGEDLRVYHETSEYRLGHSCPSPDEKWLVTDSQDLDENILMMVHLEREETHTLCWPNTSIGSNRADKRVPHLPPHTDRHTHPGFSSTGKFVHYTSDVSGRSQVYVVPVGDLL